MHRIDNDCGQLTEKSLYLFVAVSTVAAHSKEEVTSRGSHTFPCKIMQDGL
jgi:hypothetical protein